MHDRYRIDPGQKVDLRDHDPEDRHGFDGDKDAGIEAMVAKRERLAELQDLLFADGSQRLLVVFQAMDTGGKDGAIRSVFGNVDPIGIRAVSFKKPSESELAHDYLWRVHQHVPGDGELTIFNRSHYEDVLVVRVHELVPEERWRKRYEHIRAFERLLVDEGTTVVKFFLHISKDEQKERLQARLDNPEKHWKFAVADLAERERWDDYMAAFEDAIAETSTADAPWYVVPANRKWYRDLVVADVLIDTLEALDLHFPENEDDLSQVTIT